MSSCKNCAAFDVSNLFGQIGRVQRESFLEESQDNSLNFSDLISMSLPPIKLAWGTLLQGQKYDHPLNSDILGRETDNANGVDPALHPLHHGE